jgi:hypothetical protein
MSDLEPIQPPQIERQISMLIKGLVRDVESLKYSQLWTAYIYFRITMALLEESRCEMTDTATRLLEESPNQLPRAR